jgi:hypothetical protein
MSEEARLVFEAQITEDGRIKPLQVAAAGVRLQRWRGRKVLVTVSRWVKPKSQPQLGYYFSTIVPFWSEHTGYEQDEMHVELKRAYLAKVRVVSRITGEETWETPSLAGLSSEKMSEFISRCIKEAALQGVRIPSSEEYYSA